MKKTTAFAILFIQIFLNACNTDISDISTEIEKASFIIYTFDEFGTPSGSGSGFFINENGTAITNYHVLDGSVKAIIVTNDSTKYVIENVLGSSEKLDLIRFKVKNPDNKLFSVVNLQDRLPKKGEKVYCLSNPLGYENSMSEGIISAIRTDKSHEKVIQFSAAISPGSSGGTIFGQNGKVFAVATFMNKGGQSLNFGIPISKEIIDRFTKEDDFKKNNPKFFKSERFIVLNRRSDKDPNAILNAIEFGDNITTVYLTYTNLHISEGKYGIWLELNKNQQGAFIRNIEDKSEIYITSSTIGSSRELMTLIPIGTSLKYKMFFTKVNDPWKHFELFQCGDSRCNKWTDIKTGSFTNLENFDLENFRNIFAISSLKEGNFQEAQSLFLEIIKFDPENVQAYNALGVISYISDNNNDALKYFTKAIEVNPTFDQSFINRYYVYLTQRKYSEALKDITEAINLNPDQPDFYSTREKVYLLLGDKENAKHDYFIAREIYLNDYQLGKEVFSDQQKDKLYDDILQKRAKRK